MARLSLSSARGLLDRGVSRCSFRRRRVAGERLPAVVGLDDADECAGSLEAVPLVAALQGGVAAVRGEP